MLCSSILYIFILKDLDDPLDWVAGLDWICNPDKWLATVSAKLAVQAHQTHQVVFPAALVVPRHFLEATGILNGGEGSVFRWNQGKQRKPNVKMFHRSKSQVFFFLAPSNYPKLVIHNASWSCSKKISTSCGCLLGAYSLFGVHRGLEPMTTGASH